MERNEGLLRDLKRTYERSRLRRGVRVGALAFLMVVPSMCWCGSRPSSLALGVALAAAAAAFVWRGGAFGRGVVPGLVAGIAPLIVPALVAPACTVGSCDEAARYHLLVLACVLGGLTSGAIIAYFAFRSPRDKGIFVFSAGMIAALAGSIGCVIVGAGGIAAMIASLAAVSVPSALAPVAEGSR